MMSFERLVFAVSIAAASFLPRAPARADEDSKADAQKLEQLAALEKNHAAKCAGCGAEAVWERFVEHLRALKHDDWIPKDLLPIDSRDTDEGVTREEHVAYQQQLLASDVVKGILFKLSPELVNLDALYSEAAGQPLSAENLEKARALAAKLRESQDSFLPPYGILYGAMADIQAGECASALKALEPLLKSCFFLPRREAHRHLARAHSCAGDDTLALLEVQYFLLDLPEQSEADHAWAADELRKIRDKKHPGPLHHSEENMRSISTLISGLEVRDPTQQKERRVEDILAKVAELLERKAGACSSGMACPNATYVLVPGGEQMADAKGKGKGKKKGSKPGQEEEEGDPSKNDASEKAAKKTKLDQEEDAAMKLRDATPEELEAWGRINDREVARSLKELWDKIPPSYRLMVTQYFKELSDPEAEKTAK
jgi:hypothetical protein